MKILLLTCNSVKAVTHISPSPSSGLPNFYAFPFQFSMDHHPPRLLPAVYVVSV